jgi:WD40 repeat protein
VIVSFTSDIIYFVHDAIWSIPASGGSAAPRKLVAMDKTVDAKWTRPVMLPDDKTIALCVVPRSDGPSRLALLSLADGKRSMLDVPGQSVVGYADGMLAFLQDGRLMGVRLDVGSKRVGGDPMGLLSDVGFSPNTVTMGPDGTLAFLAENTPASRIEIVDESGAVAATLSDAHINSPAVSSPDGKRIAFSTEDGPQQDIWLYDVASRVMTRLAQGTTGWQPSWTRDGKRIAFLGQSAVWTAADGSGAAEPIPGMSALEKSPSKMTLSRDGKYAIALFTGQVRGAGEAPAAAVPLGGGEAIPILSDAQAPQAVDVSPDGKWIAYESRETGHHEVYVSPFPTGSGQIQVSEKSGDDPQWSPDGRRLYYRSDTEFRAATLDVSGAIPRVVHIDTLFAKRNHTDDRISTFSVHPDGRHFVVTHPLGDPVTLNVVTNWLAEARARFARR